MKANDSVGTKGLLQKNSVFQVRTTESNNGAIAFYIYNDFEDIDKLTICLKYIKSCIVDT